jgi:hypothetical protein
MDESAQPTEPYRLDAVRDPLAGRAAILEARRRPMSERLELALSWDALVAELRAGLAEVTGRQQPKL